MTSILDDIKREFESGNYITRLILVNLIVFVSISLLRVFANFPGADGSSWFETLWRYITLSNDWSFNLTRPWVFVTHMFLHIGFWHILWNMLFLYWFGRRVGDLIGDKHIVPLYFYGGFAGALTLLLTASSLGYIPEGTTFYAHGASAAVMAFVVASAVLAPDSYMNLILIGPVKLKYVAFAIVLLDILALGSDMNTGGHFGHLGGAAMGWFYIYALRNGMNLAPDLSSRQKSKSAKIHVLSDHASRSRSKRRTTPTTSLKKYFSSKEDQHEAVMRNIDEEIDRILEKIKEKGIESLTAEEKSILDQASKK